MKKAMFLLGVMVTFLLVLTAGWLVVDTIGGRIPEPVSVETTTEATTIPTTEAPTEATTEATTEPVVEDTTGPTEPENPYELASHHVFVYDLTNDALLYHMGGMYDRVFPASITKLFTARVALNYLDPEDHLTAGDELDLMDPESTVAWIYKGQTVTVATCIQGMLMQSGNDAAYILAVGAGRAIAEDPDMGYQEALAVFLAEMNRSTRLAGLYDTQFRSPDGIHSEDHYTTMADLTTFCRLALENDIIREACSTAKADATYVSGQSVTWTNTNAQLREDSEYYNPYACGLKTGTTSAAGNCLVSAYLCGDRVLLIGVLGAEQYADRYTDTAKLFEEFSGISYSPNASEV